MSPWIMHRDPRFFDHPEQFDPERWTSPAAQQLPRFAYFPFGGGPRVCIGAAFAMMEAKFLLAAIAQRFQLQLVPGPPVVPQAGITLRPRHGMRMKITKAESGVTSE
jgi:cytochrome P450